MTVDNDDTTNNETTKKVGEYSKEYMLQRARELVAERTKTWEITNIKAEDRIPRFHRNGM
jgi:hypothetical protein